jgi:UDP-N-acetylglucosamine:LPS N-acetylglucosamine transferase
VGERLRILLVCSSGGHLAQLVALRPWWEHHDRRWITFDLPDALSLLADEETVWAHHPTTRNLPNLARNWLQARHVVREFRPDVVITTGAAVALPYFVVGRRHGARTVYVEVYDRIDTATLTANLCRPVTDLMLVQWPDQRSLFRRSVTVGQLL